MSWSLRLVERVDGGDGRSVDVVDIGEIAAPTEISMIGLTTVAAKTVLGALQTEIVALQEAALTQAAQRSPWSIKDHRRRVLQTPFGEVALRVPQLRGRGDEAKLVAWPRHARSTPEFDRLRARLAAWMSYPASMALLNEVYPAASGVALATAHRTMARVADEVTGSKTADDAPGAAQATLQLDTTFIRRAMKKMVGYVENSQARLVNYAGRHRTGERVATSLVEGGADHLVNARMARTQHMRWSEHGAFNVLQIRAAHFNQRLAQTPRAA